VRSFTSLTTEAATKTLSWDGTDFEGDPSAPAPNQCEIGGDSIAEGFIAAQ
jgi:hypothetical protein